MHYITLIIILFWLHCLLDFALQTEFMASYKGKHWFVMTAHVTIWAVPIAYVLQTYGKVDFAVSCPILFVTHYAADLTKIKLLNTEKWREKVNLLFLGDQLFHVLTLAILALPVW